MPRPPIMFTCPACGSDRVRVIGSQVLSADACGRRRLCRECRHVFPTVALTDVVGDLSITLERAAPLRPSSIWDLRRRLQNVRALL